MFLAIEVLWFFYTRALCIVCTCWVNPWRCSNAVVSRPLLKFRAIPAACSLSHYRRHDVQSMCVLFRTAHQQQPPQQQQQLQQQQQRPVPPSPAAAPASTRPVAATQGPSQRPQAPTANSTAATAGYPRPAAPPSSAAAAAATRPASESSRRCSVCGQVATMTRMCAECRRDVCPQCGLSAAPTDVRIANYLYYHCFQALFTTSWSWFPCTFKEILMDCWRCILLENRPFLASSVEAFKVQLKYPSSGLLTYRICVIIIFTVCLQCFLTVGWASGRASGL